ncbi:MAG: hypothetical protein IJI54_04105 [Kiritimatiellae bacterium]|nr:hypothetical protein [Kiritimatiellia bacterium]
MKRTLILIAAAAAAGAARAETPPSYTLAIPGAPVIRDTADASQNAWLASNCVASVSASFGGGGVSLAETPGLDKYTLASSEAGFGVERIKPSVWLGDVIVPPADVDWDATYAHYLSDETEQSKFIFDNVGKRVYVQSGGSLVFRWIGLDGTATDRTYIASGATSGRPLKMFWTEPPWNAPTIDLSGKFVKLFGPDELIKVQRGERIKDTGGYSVVESNVVVKGVYLDPSANTLSAYGRVSGQFILAYYDSGSFNTLKHIQVVEVGEPDVVEKKGFIGEEITPHGTGYSTKGLWPSPITATSTATTQEDEFGPYYYQHKGLYSYSPKNNCIFPLRETADAPWRIDVYWMEEDAYGVSWPFERCQYACTWNTNAMPVLVAGDSVKIPDVYTPTLNKYQTPNGHARAPQDNVFTATSDLFTSPTQVGYSCLKLATTDNVWFLPIRTVARTNPDFFTLEAAEWHVGSELVPRGGSVSGTAPGYNPVIDTSIPGKINLAESGSHYNPDLYYDWATTSNAYPSVIYAVNTSKDGKPIEVHWFATASSYADGMPEKIAIPCLVQRYSIAYPEPDQVPQIVIASQKGGAGESVYEDGSALFFDAAESSVELPDAMCFSASAAYVSFWADAGEMEASGDSERCILSLGGDSTNLVMSAQRNVEGNVRYTATVTCGERGAIASSSWMSATSGWHKVSFSLNGSGACLFVDGVADGGANVTGLDLSGYLTGNRLGAQPSGAGALAAARGLALDNIVVCAVEATAESEKAGLHDVPDSGDSRFAMLLTFPEGDLVAQPGSSVRRATEEVSGRSCRATSVLRSTPGSPRRGNGVFLADARPVIYRQPDASKPGYNPNEEHAFVGSGSGGYFAWALRCDLNTAATSEPGVLVQYVANGRPAMKYFSVLLTNEMYSVLADTMTAGTMIPGPHPLDTFDNPWLPETYWDNVGTVSPAFPDRKNQVWARCAGTIPIHMFYPNQDGFDFVDGAVHKIGEPVAWLSNYNNGKPLEWTWTVEWPKNVETMKIGETLTVAANGLPEVWAAKSMAVVYPADNAQTALLWDPTVVRKTGLPGFSTPAALLKNFGFDPADGNVTLRGGKYTFKDLPPSIGGRFYVNSALAVEECVCLAGERVVNAGGSILYPNVLNQGEVDAIKALVSNGNAKKADWDRLINTLPRVPVVPSVLGAAGNGKASVDYKPKDHYALTAMGATNYVTVIENDSTNVAMRVESGDPISMHVFRVVDDYYAGRVVTREDPLNLLSQQLTILYTESFAGKADDYEFEWKKAVPNENGSMSSDYENVYKDVFDSDNWGGLTRFTIGGQGDTLANLVNTYYVMRYRAKPGTPARAVMGDRWSDWCGPALAEGWIQRCVNNVTPFTQRMQDLYSNPAETTITMIRQAGAPWAGDVALSQDNLANVGLIQLYQTLLNKAESMSLTLGLNDTDANKQLLLAAERLADLYVLLGNEAYADALDPTVGFGSGYGASAITPDIDYGYASTGLFCFDNQVQSLLDEELALLRGRTGVNNPSVTTAPFYNRLVWNFTRGITAGEVAYANNYSISSDDVDSTIDADDAALQYPQGHGDAWGHYLSAMSVWYRLLRNPNFSWSTSQMQMNVADSVVDVDYFDEERFAETAGKLAKTANEIMDRTARKSWRDSGGVKGAGYLDEDGERNFGYGEWATRGAIGGVMNWMVANSLLPNAESAGEQHFPALGDGSYMWVSNAPIIAADGPWTFECTVNSAPAAGNVVAFVGAETYDLEWEPEESDSWVESSGLIMVKRNGDGSVTADSHILDRYLESYETNVVVELKDLDTGEVTNTVNSTGIRYRLNESSRDVAEGTVEDVPTNAIFAVSFDGNEYSLRIVDENGVEKGNVALGSLPMDTPDVRVGGVGFRGLVTELRFWDGYRSTSKLHAERAFVNPREESLVAYTRGFSDTTAVDELPDDTPGGDVKWQLHNPRWMTVKESGLNVAFDDEGLLRINRSTAQDLVTIPNEVEAIQRKLDRLDSGMNPLGLSDAAVPFDITPEGVADGSSTHFEQIAERAETALGNAAKMMDRAQEAAKTLRQVQDGELIEDDFAQESETDYKAQLIAIYGTPYEDDIGPTGTYPQGYDGPDIYHYMYMDLSLFGITGADNIKPVSVMTYDSAAGGWKYESMKDFMSDGKTYSTSKTMSYQLSANGLVVKPDSIKGARRACGKIQDDYTAYILAYIDWQNACSAYNGKYNTLSVKIDNINAVYHAQEDAWISEQQRFGFGVANCVLKMLAQNASASFKMSGEFLEDGDQYLQGVSKMSAFTVGLASGFTPGLALYSAAGGATVGMKAGFKGLAEMMDGIAAGIDSAQEQFESRASLEAACASWNEAKKAAFDEAKDAIDELKDAAVEVKTTWAAMVAAAENFDTTVAEGDRIQTEREKARARRVNRFIRLRYQDMFFRQMRNEALTRYSQAFDLAQKYVYMAAQVYDYETTLLSADRASGDTFRSEIIGARALGVFDDDGKPVMNAGYGDAGLADILARMQANYLVLKPRLGINNPDRNATWFSLRSELFRIEDGAEGDADWRLALSKCVVDDIRTVPEYRRYCQSVASSSSLQAKEPAIVIRFSSTIDFAKNFFGKDLEAGDHALDSSYYATKIAGAGVKFDNYPSNSLAATPVVYLIPAGADRMRIPGGGENGTVLDWNVADQVIPVPYSIGSTELDDADWLPLYTGYSAGVETLAKIRRMPSFRALIADEDDDDKALASTRLIGRSAWNTKWVMIIPAGQLLGGNAEDRARALSVFINGEDTNRDGLVDVPGISDIELGLKTYATSGN